MATSTQPVAGPDLPAEPNVLHAPEGDEALVVQAELMAEEAAELRGRLADQHARHQRVIAACVPRTQNSSGSTSL